VRGQLNSQTPAPRSDMTRGSHPPLRTPPTSRFAQPPPRPVSVPTSKTIVSSGSGASDFMRASRRVIEARSHAADARRVTLRVSSHLFANAVSGGERNARCPGLSTTFESVPCQ
jgi:hypothetical protein